MTPRSRQWLVTAIVCGFVLAVATGWLSYLHSRSTPHYLQAPPGQPAAPEQEGGMPMRLASLTVTQQLVTDQQANVAPANALWVIAVVEYTPPPEGGSCRLDLLAVDGRRWSSRSPFDFEGSRVLQPYCTEKPGEGTRRAEFVYLIPEDAAGSLAGLTSAFVAYRGTQPYLVLTPPGG